MQTLDLDYLAEHGRLSLEDAKAVFHELNRLDGVTDEAVIQERWGLQDHVYEMTQIIWDQAEEEMKKRQDTTDSA